MRKKGSLVSVSLSSQKGKVGCNSGGKENGIAKYIYITLANINLQNLAFLWNGLVSVFQLDEKFEIRGEKLVQANCLVEIFLLFFFFIGSTLVTWAVFRFVVKNTNKRSGY